jgi:hypothetical protein
MQNIAGTLLHNKNEEACSLLQLQLRKKSLKEEEPEMLLKNKNNVNKVILFHLSPILSPNRKKFC